MVLEDIAKTSIKFPKRCTNECFDDPKSITPGWLPALLPEHTGVAMAQEVFALWG